MTNIKQIIGASTASLGLVLGLAGGTAGATSVIDTTGPDSINTITNSLIDNIEVTNANEVTALNDNAQAAVSGDATVDTNTTGGDAETGNTSNSNTFNVDATIDNTGYTASELGMNVEFGSGSIENTGPASNNSISFDSTRTVTIDNTNTLEATNTNVQTATSGEALVTNNTTGGNAKTGSASNINNSSMTYKVSN